MTIKKDPKMSPEELTPPLVGPIEVTLSGNLLHDLNTYRQMRMFIAEFPRGTQTHPLDELRKARDIAADGIATYLADLAQKAKP